MSQIFLIGTGLSLAYGVMGALLIDWLGTGCKLATLAAPQRPTKQGPDHAVRVTAR
jgi:hypothetical protein